MTSISTLSPQQIQTFKEVGYLVVKGVFEQEYLDAWRNGVWQSLGADANDPATWTNRIDSPEMKSIPPSRLLHNHPTIAAMVDQMGGGQFECGHDSCVVTWPTNGEWSLAGSGHVDGYARSIGWWPFMLSATAYAYDVEHKGGGLTLWPGSHLKVWRYFHAHPENLDFTYLDDPVYKSEVLGHIGEPHEVIADAGDVIFWHAFMMHTGSANLRALPRIGMFTRWRHVDQEQIKYEVPDNLFKYWGV